MSPELRKIVQSDLEWLGLQDKVTPAECDFCEDGSVWWGLLQVSPKGTVQRAVTDTLERIENGYEYSD